MEKDFNILYNVKCFRCKSTFENFNILNSNCEIIKVKDLDTKDLNLILPNYFGSLTEKIFDKGFYNNILKYNYVSNVAIKCNCKRDKYLFIKTDGKHYNTLDFTHFNIIYSVSNKTHINNWIIYNLGTESFELNIVDEPGIVEYLVHQPLKNISKFCSKFISKKIDNYLLLR